MNRFSKLTCAAVVAILLAGFGPAEFGISVASAQSDGLDGTGGLLRADGLGGAFDESAGDLIVHASILPPTADRPAQLAIVIDIPDGWHTYSITQPAGGPNRTLIKLDPSDEYKLGGNYRVDPAPHVHTDEAFPGVPQEEHTGHVTWTAPLEFRQGVDLSRLRISGAVNAQRCSTGCLAPKDFKFTATFVRAPVVVTHVAPASLEPAIPNAVIPAHEVPATAAAPTSESAVEPAKWEVYQYQAKDSAAVVHGWVEPSFVAPGSTARLVLSIAPGPKKHVYALADHETNELGKPTLIVLEKTPPHWTFDRPRPDRPPVEETTDVGPQTVYNAPVTWIVDVHVPPDAAGNYPVGGILGYQACTAQNCEIPQAVRFKGEVVVTADRSQQANDVRPLSFLPAVYREAAQAAAKGPLGAIRPSEAAAAPPAAPFVAASAFLRQLHPQIKGTEPTNLATVILFGLLGGLILNLMPCVLPVIGLKILGFVEQGGQSRARTLVLNIWYSLGLLSVFMVLAAVAVNLHLKWGQQFQSSAFVIVMCGVVFVMALSFLGVWEIPIPGFVGSGKSVKLAAKEGAAGAFAKGVLTTVLATPCSGPYLGAVFSYALTQSPLVTYIVFASIGLGMASPYLLIGAFPAMIRFLPKPGMWMETFKQFMGFVLLATVVYLFSLLDKDLFVPVLALMIGLWAACWWIGRTPLTADLGRKLRAWGIGAGVAAAVGWFSLTVLVPHPEVPHPAELDWQPYSEARLDQLLGEGKTVMIDFTASWCLTCRLNSLHALNTQPVKQFVTKNGVVPMLADKSHSSPEIDQMLDALHSNTIPVLAIFPAAHPHEPIVLRDLVSQSGVVEALREAGPSRGGLAAAR